MRILLILIFCFSAYSAEVVRFINTASTAGGDGTTNDTTGANRAYASMSEWEAAEQTDLVAAGDNHLVHAEGVKGDTVSLTITGWTTGSGNGIEIRVDTDKRHTGRFNINKYRIVGPGVFGEDVINVDETDVAFVGVQVQMKSTGSASTGIMAETSSGMYSSKPIS